LVIVVFVVKIIFIVIIALVFFSNLTLTLVGTLLLTEVLVLSSSGSSALVTLRVRLVLPLIRSVLSCRGHVLNILTASELVIKPMVLNCLACQV
jgi:hypothetical protein